MPSSYGKLRLRGHSGVGVSEQSVVGERSQRTMTGFAPHDFACGALWVLQGLASPSKAAASVCFPSHSRALNRCSRDVAVLANVGVLEDSDTTEMEAREVA